jgi:Plasmid encoded RepA protein
MIDKHPDMFGFTSEEEALLQERGRPDRPKKNSLSKVVQRAIKASADIALDPPNLISYQHSVLCQTSLPYRNPGNDVLSCEREQGAVSLLVDAGKAKNPDTGKWIQLGLPFGPKPRLILAYLNAQAIKTGSPVIEMEDSLTAFVKRIQNPLMVSKTGPNGYEIRAFKDHLGRLSAATIRMAIAMEDHTMQVNSQIVDAFDLWFPKNDKERVLWPSTVHLNDKYFASLVKHAVPLDERALSALSHSAMALDIYSWLAQRLHRIPVERPQFITWIAVKEQFGHGHKRMNNFKSVFRIAMKQVLIQYPVANVKEDGRGLTLRNSLPPVSKKLFLVNKAVS